MKIGDRVKLSKTFLQDRCRHKCRDDYAHAEFYAHEYGIITSALVATSYREKTYFTVEWEQYSHKGTYMYEPFEIELA